MAFALHRPAVGTPRRLDSLWVVVGAAMLGLAAMVSYRTPEESLAILLATIILFVAFTDLRTGFLTFVALYPLMPESWGIDVAPWMPFLTARRLCLIVLAVVFLLHTEDALDTPRVRRLLWFFGVLVALEMVSGFASSDPLSAIKRIFDDVLEHYVPFLMAAHLFRTKEQVRTLLIVALTTLALVSVLAIVEHTIDYDIFDSFTAARAEVNDILYHQTQSTRVLGGTVMHRSRVAFPHSIVLGLHLMWAMLASIYLVRKGKATSRVLLIAGMLLYCLAMLFTFSRGPMLGLLCSLVWLGLIGRGTRSLLLAVLVCGAGAFFLMPASARRVLTDTVETSTDIISPVSTGGGTVRARLVLLQMGLAYSGKSLLFGHGPAAVRDTTVITDQGNVVNFGWLDNYYLGLEMQYGIFVLGWDLLLLGYLLYTFTRAALKIADRDAALLAALAAAACFGTYVSFVSMAVEHSLHWILLGVALRAAEIHLPVGKNRKPRRPHPEEDHQRMEPRRHPSAKLGAPPRSLTGRAIWTALVLAVAAVAGAAPAHAAPSFYGTTGLFATPTAEVAPRGAWSLGSNYVGRNYRPGASSISQGTVANFFTLTMLPRLELTVVLTNYEGKIGTRNLNHGLTPDFDLGGYTVDRTASAQWLALTQHGVRPSLALGARDFLGRPAKHLQAQYAVMSWNRGPLTLSGGFGTLALHGPFGGFEYAFTPHVMLITEGMHGQANGGFRFLPLHNVQLDLAMMGLRSLGGGLSYRRKF